MPTTDTSWSVVLDFAVLGHKVKNHRPAHNLNRTEPTNLFSVFFPKVIFCNKKVKVVVGTKCTLDRHTRKKNCKRTEGLPSITR